MPEGIVSQHIVFVAKIVTDLLSKVLRIARMAFAETFRGRWDFVLAVRGRSAAGHCGAGSAPMF